MAIVERICAGEKPKTLGLAEGMDPGKSSEVGDEILNLGETTPL